MEQQKEKVKGATEKMKEENNQMEWTGLKSVFYVHASEFVFSRSQTNSKHIENIDIKNNNNNEMKTNTTEPKCIERERARGERTM